jgi:hypothetical protein
MAVTFTPRITWKEGANQLAYPFDWFGITPPRDLPLDFVRPPKFVNSAEMSKLVRDSASSTPAGLWTVEGHVSSDFQISFTDPDRQWVALPGPDGKPPVRGPASFQFQGGEVILDLTLGLYILDSRKPRDDEKSSKIFAILYEHELLHVLDETDIIKNWLPRMAMVDPDVIKYFIRTEPFIFGLQSQSIADARKEFLDKYISHILFNLWATEVNRREGIRDAPGEYKKISQQIEKIQYGGRLP